MFSADGSLLVCKDKSDLMSFIESVTVQQEGYNDTSEATKYVKLISSEVPRSQALLVDAMAVIQRYVKKHGSDDQKLLNMSRSYPEIRNLDYTGYIRCYQ